MKKLIFLASLAAISTAAAADSGRRPVSDGDELVCRNVGETGSRLSRKRICQTRSQWAEQRRIQRQEIERLQATRGPRTE